ncbi:hypothetical protein ACFX12_030420 [Malus domestica]
MSEPCVVAWNAMIDGFGKNGEMGYAVLLFESKPKRDVVSWTSVISGFGRNGCGCAVLSLFASVNYVSGFGWNGCSENVISCIGCMMWLLCNQEKIRGWKGHCVSSKCNCIPPRLYFSLVAVFVRILVIMLKNSAEKNENKKKRKE